MNAINGNSVESHEEYSVDAITDQLQTLQTNSVSVLHEICAKNGFKTPVYNELERFGPCHEPIFSFSCQVLFGTEPIEAKGSAKTKQLAKRSSADEVLKILQQRQYPLISKKKTKSNSRQIDSNVDKQNECKEYFDLMQTIELSSDLETLFDAKDTDFCLRLNIMAEKLKCFVKYMSLTEDQSKSHKYKCLIQIELTHVIPKRLPVFVSWGTSDVSQEEAMQNAAKKAIIIVKVLKL